MGRGRRELDCFLIKTPLRRALKVNICLDSIHSSPTPHSIASHYVNEIRISYFILFLSTRLSMELNSCLSLSLSRSIITCSTVFPQLPFVTRPIWSRSSSYSFMAKACLLLVVVMLSQAWNMGALITAISTSIGIDWDPLTSASSSSSFSSHDSSHQRKDSSYFWIGLPLEITVVSRGMCAIFSKENIFVNMHAAISFFQFLYGFH